jgi:hypothetical protein
MSPRHADFCERRRGDRGLPLDELDGAVFPAEMMQVCCSGFERRGRRAEHWRRDAAQSVTQCGLRPDCLRVCRKISNFCATIRS